MVPLTSSSADALNPALLGWRSVETDQLQCTARIEGRLPAEMQGSFYRNGPAVHERFGLRYRHLFDGDGMVQAFRFDGRGVSHRARVLATPKLVREIEAGRRLFSGFATPVVDSAPVRRADDINTANNSVLDHHGELLALWEGGSASVLDRETLQWQRFKVWGEGLEGLPLTADPKVEPDGTLWAFGYNLVPVRALVLYHIAADGTVVKAQTLDPGPLGMVHDFVVTARHLIIAIPPLVYRPVLVETFVDPARFDGACYRAANWRHLGETAGKRSARTPKSVFVQPLDKDFRAILVEGRRRAPRPAPPGGSADALAERWGPLIDAVVAVARDFDRHWQRRRRSLTLLTRVNAVSGRTAQHMRRAVIALAPIS